MKIKTVSKEEKLLLSKDALICVAVPIFIISVLPFSPFLEVKEMLRAVAYFFGASAYLFEILDLTELFTKKRPFKEMLMPYMLFVTYIVLCVSYAIDAAAL